MNLDERLKRDSEKKPEGDPYYDEEPDYAGYLPFEKMPFINDYKGVFKAKDEDSINKRPDVFERTAVFKVSVDKNEKI